MIPIHQRYTVGIYSDTHGWLDPQLVTDFGNCSEVWHAGDVGNQACLEPWRTKGNLKAVWGNIDGQEIKHLIPEYHVFDVQGFRVLLIHIAGKHPRYSPKAQTLIQKYEPQMLVCGHSHICRVVQEGGILYVNPGAAGHHGFHHKRTALKISFENGKPVEVRVLELGNRTVASTPVSVPNNPITQ